MPAAVAELAFSAGHGGLPHAVADIPAIGGCFAVHELLGMERAGLRRGESMIVKSVRQGIAGVVVAAAVVLGPGSPASALPDLVPEITDVSVDTGDVLQGDVVEGCAGGRYNRRLVRFSLRTRNLGADDLLMGNPGCPNCSLNPGSACTNPLYVCGLSHGHAHFNSFAKTEILDADDNVVAESRKYGFCLLDLNCPNPHYSCSYQGITAGCSDVYAKGLPCQYVDITDDNLPDGIYKLRTTLDPDNVIGESDNINNTVVVPFTIGNTPAVCPAYTASDVPSTIPEIGSVSSTITIPDQGPVRSLRLRLNGTHTFPGDIDATLTSPSGTTRTLFSRICGTADNFNLYLGDDAVDPITCPATDASILRTPLEDFAAFDGEPTGGNWTLTITDHSLNDSGTLAAWSLEICSICGNGRVDPGEMCDDGNAADGDCCSADCHSVADDGTTCEDGDQCTTDESCTAGVCLEGATLACDPCLVCDPDQGCVVPDLFYPCQQAPTSGSLLQLRHNDLDPARDSLLWRWRSQTPVELDELGAPDLLTDVSLCVYESDALLLSATIPAAQLCDNGEPCWEREPHLAIFRDGAAQFGGLTSLRFKEGRRGRIQIKGSGDGLAIPGLFPSLPATVRLQRNDGTPCWEANFDVPRTDSETLFRARSR